MALGGDDVVQWRGDDVMHEEEQIFIDNKRKHVFRTQLSTEFAEKHGVADRAVVVKRFKMCDELAQETFYRELKWLKTLSDASDAIVRPLAAVIEAPTYAVVLPFYTNGSLDKILHAPDRPEISEKMKVCFIHDVVSAVLHCHDVHKLIVRDIKPANFLVDENYFARLADLELCRTEGELLSGGIKPRGSGPAGKRRNRFEGTPEYLAPEVLQSFTYQNADRSSTASDVFAVGISVNEILTGIVPYTDCATTTEQLHTVVETRYTPAKLYQAICDEALRPKTNPDADAVLTALAQQCWEQETSKRPPIKDVLEQVSSWLSTASVSPLRGDRAAYRPSVSPTAVIEHAEAAPVPADPKLASMPTGVDWTSILRASSPAGAWLPSSVQGKADGLPGRRELMEDAWFYHEWFASSAGVVACYGVLDGHAGDGCAKFAKGQLPALIAQNLSASPGDVAAILKASFLQVDQSWGYARAPDDRSGACATVVLIIGATIWVANVGDCRAVLCCDKSPPITLTVDHYPDLPSEKTRIEAAGASVSPDARGRLRVGGKLEISRSLGDAWQHLGVTAEPSIQSVSIKPEHDCVVAASDGVWAVMTADKVQQKIRNTLRHPDYGPKRIGADAWEAGSSDNICVACVYFGDEPQRSNITGGYAAGASAEMGA